LATPLPGPPQTVPYYRTPLATSGHIMVVADSDPKDLSYTKVGLNGDALGDLAVVIPGTNKLSVYLANADGSFQDPLNATFGTASSRFVGLAMGDFNADKKQDLAILDAGNNSVILVYGKGDGSFVSPMTIPVGKNPTSITITDVNQDGKPDILVTNGGDNTVSVIRSSGNGTFIPTSSFAVGKNPTAVLAQDMNADGNLDLVVANSGSSDLAVLFGYGNGGFQGAQFTRTPFPANYLASADFNSDGNPDIAALSTDGNAIMMFTSNTQAKLTLAGSYLTPNLTASLTLNDFDGDGYLDMLVPDTDSGSAVLLLGRGDGTLLGPPAYGTGNGLTSLTAGDFNGDGKTDLLMTGASSTGSTLSLLPGSANGQFQPAVNIPVPGRTDVVAVGDFNKDGRLDIAVLGSQLNILLNQGGNTFRAGAQYASLIPSIVADFDKDGRLDIGGPFNGGFGVMLGNGDGTFRGPAAFNVGSNPTAAVSADFNRDSSLDVAVLNTGTPGNSADPGGVSVLMGSGAGSFGPAINIAAGLNPRALAVADVNGDGRPDLIVANGSTAAGYQVAVMLGKGDGTFQQPTSVPLPAGEAPNTLAVTDIDGDGNPDIIAGDCCSDASTVYFRGNGDGTFQPYISFYGGNNVRSIVTGDWNGDGKPDLALGYSATGNPSVGGVAVLTNYLKNTAAITVTSAASFLTGPIAPDSITTLFGKTLTTETGTAGGDISTLPTLLANTTVTIQDSKGVSQSAQLYYVSPTQINLLVPSTVALGPARIIVTAPNGVTTAQTIINSVAPGLFTSNAAGLAAGTGVRVSGGVQSIFNLSYFEPTLNANLPLLINLGGRNDQVFLTLFGTGLRGRSGLDRVQVLFNGQFGQVTYAGSQSQFLGLDQINVQIPQSVAGAGKVTIQVSVDGAAANPVFVTVQ
jgi:uncharacterized protein (TIGR03437 family)